MNNRSDLFIDSEFTSHSGLLLPFKIDCDALTDGDLDTLAAAIARRVRAFRSALGVPRGGVRLADALRPYAAGVRTYPFLIVDDVLTTGKSMEEARDRAGANSIGAVIFARGPCLEWITPLFIENTCAP